MDELRDIKPIIDYAPGWPWWAWALIAVAVIKVGVLLWLLRRRRNGVAPVQVDPNQAALVALDALAGVSPRDRLSGQRLQTQLSMILRRWVEARWSVGTTDMTTEEIAGNLAVARALGAQGRESLLAALALADRVRFADEDIAPDEHVASVTRARDLVRGMAA